MRDVVIEPNWESWRDAARRLIAEHVSPDEILWRESRSRSEPGLFDAPPPETTSGERFLVPREFLDLARKAAVHPDPDRWRILYSALFRIAHGERDGMAAAGVPDLDRLRRLAADVDQGRVPPPDPVGARSFLPATGDWNHLARAAMSCRGCDLYRQATQTVFGKGPTTAGAVLVGEQPGDQEDLQGAPFVGPAGEVLDRALAAADLSRDSVYVTNAVKHFKFIERGKRRIHQTPNAAEIGACRPWLEAELAIVRPRVLVCLGATASKALLGPDFRITRDRGRFLKTAWAPQLLATYHPSAVLRAEDTAGQERIYSDLVADLKLVAGALR
ncbi:MAG TPA: UdgX family uracil-DNA binding protein [Thermoanaerobaculia bacterium]